MQKREGHAGTIRITGKLAKVTLLINKVVDGLDKLNVDERVWSGWFVVDYGH